MKCLWIPVAILIGLATFACTPSGSDSSLSAVKTETDTQSAPAADSTASAETAKSETTMDDPATRKPKDGDEVAVLKTNLGDIVLMFFPDVAPNHVARFKECCTKKIFDGTKFHRVIPGFMIQGGDPLSKDNDRNNDGTGGWGEPLKAEFNSIKHQPGILSAARTNDPNSATSQFFIVHGDASFLDGKYTAYGKVVEGMDVVDKIAKLKRDSRDNPLAENPAIIEKATIEKWPLK